MRNLPHSKWTKLVTTKPELRDPRKFGRQLPPSLYKYKRHMPLLMHGKKVVFGETVSEQNEHKRPKIFFPNVINTFVHSRLLDMNIYTKMSSEALREVDAQGGLDEYILTTSDWKFGKDKIAEMYRRKIREAYKAEINSIREREMEVLMIHGPEYIKKIQDSYLEFDNKRINKKF